jgi:DNA mismatch repair protein MutS2
VEAWVPKLRARVRIDRVAGDRVWIDWGGRRFEVGRGDLEELPPESPRAPAAPQGGFRLPEVTPEPIARELDLRGCRAEEALEKLDAFLDRARVQNLHQVRIVHGKGTGALKREVERRLDSHPLVTSFRMGELGEGGWGVTVAFLGPGAE